MRLQLQHLAVVKRGGEGPGRDEKREVGGRIVERWMKVELRDVPQFGPPPGFARVDFFRLSKKKVHLGRIRAEAELVAQAWHVMFKFEHVSLSTSVFTSLPSLLLPLPPLVFFFSWASGKAGFGSDTLFRARCVHSWLRMWPQTSLTH